MTYQSKINQSNGRFDKRHIRALVLDDNAHDRSRIRRFSEKSDLSIEITEAPSISAMSDLMQDEAFDLIMVDYHLAEGDGLDALEVIQDHALNKNAAVIMISGDGQSRTAVSAFRQGCHDFLAKDDLSSSVLQKSVLSVMKTTQMGRTDQSYLAEELKFQVQMALRASLEGGLLQSAITEGMQSAAKSIGVETGIKNAQHLQELLYVDEFSFK